MKKWICLLLLVLVSGCGAPISRLIDPLPNTGRGFWQDVSGTANAMQTYHAGHVYENAAADMPTAVVILEDKMNWLERWKARLKRLQGTTIE